jgi:hypothetical protein
MYCATCGVSPSRRDCLRIKDRVGRLDSDALQTRACSTIAPMSRQPDPERIHTARRAAIRNVIMQSRGLDLDVAERWCKAWEAEAVLEGLEQGEAYWDAGKAWIDSQCEARKRPPN